MDISLCVLARDRIESFLELVDSIRAFRGLDGHLELVVADNSRLLESQQWYQREADAYVRVTDEELWHEGFSYAKGKAVIAAANDWIVIGDVGEMWLEHGLGLVGSIEAHPECPAFRAVLDLPENVQAAMRSGTPVDSLFQDNGRIFDRRKMRLLGVIHEAPSSRRKGIGWSTYARKHPPVALLEHPDNNRTPYGLRKQALYDHLIDMIYQNPELRAGTDPHWFLEYWPRRLADGHRAPTFDEWQAMEES